MEKQCCEEKGSHDSETEETLDLVCLSPHADDETRVEKKWE